MQRPAEGTEMPAEHGATDLVTVVVPARNEEMAIRACLDSILRQDWACLEVVVVDGDSSDGMREIVQQVAQNDTRVRLVSNPRMRIPVALNIGLAEARGQWLVRVDAHSTIPAHYVTTAVSHLAQGRYGAVGGRKDGRGASPTGRAIAAALGSRFGVGGSTYHHGTHLREVDHVPFGAYDVSLLRALGGWNENLTDNEDFELDYRLGRAGHRLLFDPNMTIAWQSKQTISDLFAQYRRYGRGKAAVALLHPASIKPRHAAPPLLVPLLATGGALAPWRPRAAFLLTAPYLVSLVVASMVTGRAVPTGRRYVPAAFLAMHLGWGIGFWEGAVAQVVKVLVSSDDTSEPSG